ncbi:hypothetical protein [Luteolibacter marinus]|uniref:hypothetical protein n=1 Tax=Luteolibacter marinus TaxID=2776705 RepID=UPI00186952B5|nr:hypothetical protein [Luteolibacter marinus]
MKTLVPTLSAALLAASSPLQASSLLLNFHTTHGSDPGAVGGSYLDLSPGHASGAVAASETTWNNFATTAASSSLSYGDGSSATGVTVTFGSETSAGSGTIGFGAATINTAALYGSGGGVGGFENLVSNAGSIYGDGNNTGNSAAGRAGWLGGASNTAIGLRVDGLTAGEYTVYVMGRNTNSNVAELPITLYAGSGALSSTFGFSALTGSVESNFGAATPNPAAYNSFIAGDNYVALNVTLGAGDSLFLASDGTGTETRGFFNMVQIVAVPEPSGALLGGIGLLAFLRRRR